MCYGVPDTYAGSKRGVNFLVSGLVNFSIDENTLSPTIPHH